MMTAPELVQDLVHFLSRDTLSVADVVARVGQVVDDPGGLMMTELEPHLPGVSAARLARYPGSGLPYIVDLAFAADARPTVAALQQRLGVYKQGRTDRGMPEEFLFYPPDDGLGWQVVVIAELVPGAARHDQSQVARVALRRDPKSP